MAHVSNYYAALPHRGALSLRGPDTRRFLQGQVTCDIERLSAERSPAGACCTPQGRMVCDFRLVEREPDAVVLMLDKSLCDATLAVLGKYIVFSKAELADAGDRWLQFGLWGDDIASLIGIPPATEQRCHRRDGGFWVQCDSPARRFEVLVPAAAAETFVEKLDSAIEPAAENDYRLQEIRAGVGHVEAATADEFLPQMLNYQALDRISFTKGCYTGQEVVARMRYRGKLKRSMYLARCSAGELPPAGAALFADGGGQSVGKVVNAARDGGRVALLAVIGARALDGGTVRLGTPEGPPLEIQPLPYSLEP